MQIDLSHYWRQRAEMEATLAEARKTIETLATPSIQAVVALESLKKQAWRAPTIPMP